MAAAPADPGSQALKGRAAEEESAYAGPAATTERHLEGLRTALRADWAAFWRDVEVTAQLQLQRQEDLISQFIARGLAQEDLTPGSEGRAPQAAEASDFRLPLPRRRHSNERGVLLEHATNALRDVADAEAERAGSVEGSDGSSPGAAARAMRSPSAVQLETSLHRIDEALQALLREQRQHESWEVPGGRPSRKRRSTTESLAELFNGKPGVRGHGHRAHSPGGMHSTHSSGEDCVLDIAAQQAQATGLGMRVEHTEDSDVRVSSEYGSSTWDIEPSERGRMRIFLHRHFAEYMGWWHSVEEPEREGWLADLLRNKLFAGLCAAVIVFNGGATVYATNYQIDHLEKEPPNYEALEFFFMSFYCMELLLKLAVHRHYFFANDEMHWNLFDTVLVVFSIFDLVMSAAYGERKSDVKFMRSLRILKMAKILRGLRVMRFFTELRLMLNSLMGSLTSLFWSIVMLALIFYIFGLVFVQGAAAFLRDHGEDLNEATRIRLIETFGSVETAMLTLYETSTGGADWAAFYDVAQMIGVLEAIIFIVFVAFIQIALLNILTGIFVENAMKLAQPDRDVLALEHRKKQIADAEELRRIFELFSGCKSGTISLTEFTKQMRKGRLCAHMAMLGLDVRDAKIFFTMLANASETQEVDIKNFVDGCMRLKGPATSIDMQSLVVQTKVIHRWQRRLHKDLADVTEKLCRALAGNSLSSHSL